MTECKTDCNLRVVSRNFPCKRLAEHLAKNQIKQLHPLERMQDLPVGGKVRHLLACAGCRRRSC